MNTPRSPKPPVRYEEQLVDERKIPWQVGLGYREGLRDARLGRRLALIVSSFTHLEQDMAVILGVLLGLSSQEASGWILRSIMSVKARLDIMRALLTKAPSNSRQPALYDEILAEFSAINTLRNNYVHGLWYTGMGANKRVLLAAADDLLSFLAAREVSVGEMDELLRRIKALRTRVAKEPMATLYNWIQAPPRRRRAPTKS